MENGSRHEYGLMVRRSNWHDRMQSFPVDNPNPNYFGGSHYRTFGKFDTVYMPKTTTQELLESVQKTKFEERQCKRELINFVTYKVNDTWFSNYIIQRYELKKFYPLTTTYNEEFKAPKAPMKKNINSDAKVDPLVNRIPKCDFELLPSSPNKFMDDHMSAPSEGKKRIDYYRQLRNVTKIFK